MAARSGRCVNFGLCNKADSREAVSAAEELMCPECGKPLSLSRSGGSNGSRVKLLAALVAIAALLGGGVSWLVFGHNSRSHRQTQSNIASTPLPPPSVYKTRQTQTRIQTPKSQQRPAPVLRFRPAPPFNPARRFNPAPPFNPFASEAELQMRRMLLERSLGFGGIFGPMLNGLLTPSSPGDGCAQGGYTDYAACQAYKAGDGWAADRLQRHDSDDAERSWYDR